MSARRDGGLTCGKARFVFASATHPKLGFVARIPCVVCGRTTTVQYGETVATFKVGNETVALCCDGCLSSEARGQLAQLRTKAETR